MRRFLRALLSPFVFLRDLYQARSLIVSLAINDLKTRFVGSYLGMVWTFIQPLTIIAIYWLVFQQGFRTVTPANTNGVPYVVWLVSGMVPWFFFTEGMTAATNSLMEYSFLVKQMVFRVSILPIIKIISAFFVHLVFLGILFVLSAMYGIAPSWIHLQLIYYSLCTFFLCTAVSYFTSAISLFFRDMVQIVNLVVQVGFWATPIVWSPMILPTTWLPRVVKLNPLYYIIEGYRDCFVYQQWIYERPTNLIYFWVVVLVLLSLGIFVFRKMRPHFADVL